MKIKNICILCIALLTACKKEFNKVPDAQQQGTASGDVANNDQQKLNYVAEELLIKFKKSS